MKTKSNSEKKIAVIGAGIFGLTAALALDEKGFCVDLFEKEPEILMGASGANQLRLHRGYHYPRSFETIESCKNSAETFEMHFSEAIINGGIHYYAIANEGSYVSPEEYLEVLRKMDLSYSIVTPPFFKKEKVALVIEADEKMIDIVQLKNFFSKKLKESHIQVHLNSEANDSLMEGYDLVVVAGYADMNSFFAKNKDLRKEYQLELCEKILVELPDSLKDMSVVVMDGFFFCLDPFGSTNKHLLGNVVHAIHSSTTGEFLDIPEQFKDLLHKGLIVNPPISRFKEFISQAQDIQSIIDFFL